MFKVNYKDNKVFTTFSSAYIVDFEQVNVSWAIKSVSPNSTFSCSKQHLEHQINV